MSVVVGYMPDSRGEDALALATLIVRAVSGDLVVANVHPPGWSVPGRGAVDAEWVAYLEKTATDALAEAKRYLARRGPPVVAYVRYAHRSSGRGLAEVAADASGDLVVIGSAPGGRPGRIAIGSTADQLLHGCSAPVMMAPRGFAAEAPRSLRRLTFAFRPGADSENAVRRAAEFAAAAKIPLRLLTLMVRPPALAGRFAHHRGDAEADIATMRDLVAAEATTEVIGGASVPSALRAAEWLPGDLLACASSTDGPLRTVFLGDTSGKLVRAASCPVLVLPRS
jgi:nucleotide-binding universal stress UspA family protein